MPSGFFLLLAAQFASALADNALLIVIIARLVELDLPGWWAPMLKFGFTVSYVVLAPFVGPLADAIPKARLMAWMNAVKLLGILGLALGLHPFAAFAIVGFGASAYAPAKYGLVTELVGPQGLVRANGWLEVSVVCAALFGTVLGGLLVSPWLLDQSGVQAAQQGLQTLGWLTPSRLSLSIVLLMLVYGLAAALNLGVPDSGARYPTSGLHPRRLCQDFWQANRKLWADAEGGLSLAVTTLFWGVGATLQFAVLRWAADVLHLPLSQAAYLQAAVAVGVIAGAGAAGRWVPLHAAKRMLVFGVLLGLLIPAIASADSLFAALPLLVLVGAVGGLMVVPLNALLQHRGYKLLSAGRSIAVQGFNENASVLVMLAIYAALLALDVSIVTLMWGFGLCIASLMGLLIWRARRQAEIKPCAV
ncbi:lysophospholipid transporter LplT [Paucibacter sp. TC2R-5]|uniref:lysophospholipid transporter LplT n=1 Tax=Paucibacter sp. TC2R-5 TaxID=2893555 RepID=UPI0021E3C16D|nr:lysophospholipid transporter LplT [Paucibacter sp. TC2R-5]MCV2360371.1 lysophospholipid transporter LplT [Paucibacter sp. TC2R-5]